MRAQAAAERIEIAGCSPESCLSRIHGPAPNVARRVERAGAQPVIDLADDGGFVGCRLLTAQTLGVHANAHIVQLQREAPLYLPVDRQGESGAWRHRLGKELEAAGLERRKLLHPRGPSPSGGSTA